MGRLVRARGALSIVSVADCIVTMFLLACTISHAEPTRWSAPAKARSLAVPLFFERNLGQAAPGVAFFSRGANYDLFLDGSDAVVATHARSEIAASSPHLTLRLVEPNRGARTEGIQPCAGRLNYLIGNNRSKWRTNVPVYGGVITRGVWPGIDLIYHVDRDGQYHLPFARETFRKPGRFRYVR